jgi:hypothetical protein
MTTTYKDEWWSVGLPAGWEAEKDDDTTLIGTEDGPGMLQLRDFRSGSRDIDDADLKELAGPHAKGGGQLLRIRYGGFSGFYVHYKSEGNLWWEWWLRNGRLALHATYHCPETARASEESTVAAILGSLQTVAAGAL